jgi:hypothetical protein
MSRRDDINPTRLHGGFFRFALDNPRRNQFAFFLNHGICSPEQYPRAMPKPLNVDWSAVRVLAVAVGVREAARQMQISEDAVRQRSKREGWMVSAKASAQRALAKPVTRVSPDAVSPADALATVLSERKERSKLGLSKYAAEAAERAGESDGDLGQSHNVCNVARIHSTLWPDEPTPGILSLDVLCAVKVVRERKD